MAPHKLQASRMPQPTQGPTQASLCRSSLNVNLTSLALSQHNHPTSLVLLPTSLESHPGDAEIATGIEMTSATRQEFREDQQQPKDIENDSIMKPLQSTKRPINYSLCASILLGDFFHNFADGVFVASAFALCNDSIAWAITFATIFHELTQELADFLVLTEHGGLGVCMALTVNFISGLSVLAGGLTVLYVDMTMFTIGIILAISAGVYINIAATECMPRIENVIATTCDSMLGIIMFVVGVRFIMNTAEILCIGGN